MRRRRRAMLAPPGLATLRGRVDLLQHIFASAIGGLLAFREHQNITHCLQGTGAVGHDHNGCTALQRGANGGIECRFAFGIEV